jgi:hypothetical protein
VIGLAFAVVAASSIALAVVLELPSAATTALAAYLVAIAQIVVVTETLSPVRAVTERDVLVAQIGLLAVAIGVWARRRPRVPRPDLHALLRSLRANPPLVVLVFVVGIALVYELALGLGTPPNNWDSMTYHLSRAAAWYQHQGVVYFPSHTVRENAYQPNAEILVLFTFLFAHADTFASAWQWLAEISSLVAIFALSRRVGFDSAESLFAALLFACLSEVVLQSVTTQNDLLTASLVVTCAVFLTTSGWAGPWLAALAFGLALGTKLTAAFAIPGLLLIAYAVRSSTPLRRLILPAVVLVPVGAAYGYVLNAANTGSPLGSASGTGSVASLAQTSILGFGRTIAGVLLGTTLDLRMLPGFAPDEDLSYFGLLGAVLVVPAFVVALIRWYRGRAGRLEQAIILSVPLYLLALACVYKFNVFVGRFTLTAAALGAPLFAPVLRYRRYAASVAAVAAVTLASSVLYDHAKPSGLGDGQSIWTKSRAQAQSVQRPAMLRVLERLDACVPPTSRIGYVLGSEGWDYPLYGAALDRSLVALGQSDPLTQADRDGLGWVLLRRRDVHTTAPGWREERFPKIGLALLHRVTVAPCGNSEH